MKTRPIHPPENSRPKYGPAALTRMAARGLLLLAALFFWWSSAAAEPIPVRFVEGMVRGFLVVSDSTGERIASGDFFQVSQGEGIESRTVFHFKDGSLHDETVVYTQRTTFSLQSYRLVQMGPAFEKDMDISLERATGAYLVKTKDRQGGKEEVLDGTLELPPDVYNGMIPTVVKNLPKGAAETVHMVAFMPKPRVVGLEISPAEEVKLGVGDLEKDALHFVLHPKLGLLYLPALVLGRLPPDNHIWVVTDQIPVFVRFMGPLAADGPVWRIDLASPTWPK
jgi:hypothetical protein